MNATEHFTDEVRQAIDGAKTALCQADGYLLDACLKLPAGSASGAACSMGKIVCNLKVILRHWPGDRSLVEDAIVRLEVSLASLKASCTTACGATRQRSREKK